MKIAITSTGNTLESTVDPRFGRAAWFLIVDTDTMQLLEAINNSEGKEAAHGAGIAAAALIADKGAKALLTGRVGPKALPILEKASVQAVNDVSGTIIDAINSYSGTSGSGFQSETKQPSQAAPTQNAGGQGCGCGQGQGRGQGKGQGRGQCRR